MWVWALTNAGEDDVVALDRRFLDGLDAAVVIDDHPSLDGVELAAAENRTRSFHTDQFEASAFNGNGSGWVARGSDGLLSPCPGAPARRVAGAS